MTVGVDGEVGTYRITGVGKDGSVSVVGGPGKRWRSFRPEWCFSATRLNRAGRTVPGTLPPERRGMRQAWRAEQGFDLVGDVDER